MSLEENITSFFLVKASGSTRFEMMKNAVIDRCFDRCFDRTLGRSKKLFDKKFINPCALVFFLDILKSSLELNSYSSRNLKKVEIKWTVQRLINVGSWLKTGRQKLAIFKPEFQLFELDFARPPIFHDHDRPLSLLQDFERIGSI